MNAHRVSARWRDHETLPMASAVKPLIPQVIVHAARPSSRRRQLAAPIVVVCSSPNGARPVAVGASLNLMAVSPSIRALIGLLGTAVVAKSVVGIVARLTDSVVELGVEAAQAFR